MDFGGFTLLEWLAMIEQLIGHNGGGDMYVYMQVTRGTEFGRNHGFPADVSPTICAMRPTSTRWTSST